MNRRDPRPPEAPRLVHGSEQERGGPDPGSGLEARCLGPLAATVHGRSVVPSATKPRTLLALLLLEGNQSVALPTLQRELWGDDPPRTAHATVQTYVRQIRKLITVAAGGHPEIAKRVLVTMPLGYMIRVGESDVDLHDRLVRAGAAALDARDGERGAALFARALDLWHGEAFGDVEPGPRLRAEVVRLHSSWTTTLEQRIQADLDAGRHRKVLSELAARTVEQPRNENLRAQYMSALFRCGRRSDALATYQDARRLLVEEVGIEPGAPLQATHQAILAGGLEPTPLPLAQ